MQSERELIEKCLKDDPKSQEKLYNLFAPKMYGICLRFAKNKMEAEDILQEGFIKVFLNLKNYRYEGSLEGWIRKTIINTAINHYKKNLKSLKDLNIEGLEIMDARVEDILDKLAAKEILDYIQELPPGYRIVFNLNVIEGYTHKAIGELLGISENTSKSQLFRAKQALQRKIVKRRNPDE
jgi:RNA polymerase sigma-70 factor (ECF subfamily)